jgi:hypothetical protein
MATTDYAPRHYQRDANGFAVSKFTTWPPGEPYAGRHRADARCACGRMGCEGHAPSRVSVEVTEDAIARDEFLAQQPGGE